MAINTVVGEGTLIVLLRGADGALAFKSRLDIPLSQVAAVEVMPRTAVPPTPGTWLRAPGTHLPGLVRHGSYGTEPNRELWAVYRQRDVLVLTVRDFAYARLVLGVQDPHCAAEAIRAAL